MFRLVCVHLVFRIFLLKKKAFPYPVLFCTYSVIVDSWILTFFIMSHSLPVIIYFSVQIIQDLAIGSPFGLASLESQHYWRSLWALQLAFRLGEEMGYHLL